MLSVAASEGRRQRAELSSYDRDMMVCKANAFTIWPLIKSLQTPVLDQEPQFLAEDPGTFSGLSLLSVFHLQNPRPSIKGYRLG